jgi:branched-chain amino acid transport system ATP-binding protein
MAEGLAPAATAVDREPLLACRGLHKFFGALAAVNDLSFDVRPGEVLGIGGPNGAGKTTLFEVISGLSPADSGEILFEGRTLRGLSPERVCQRGIARTFQLNAGFDTLTARENVLVGAQYGVDEAVRAGLRFDRRTLTRADEALDRVGMAAKGNLPVKNLTVLDRKLLMIASALATEPKLLLLDEPVGGLNPDEINQMIAIVARLAEEGVTLAIIEHVMRFLVQLATRVLIMHHGEKIYEGSARGLVKDATVVEVYLGRGASARLEHLMERKSGDDRALP